MRIFIFQAPPDLGGKRVYADYPEGYDGPCRIVASSGETVAVIAQKKDAITAAIHAVSLKIWSGGDAEVVAAREEDVTHATFIDFLRSYPIR